MMTAVFSRFGLAPVSARSRNNPGQLRLAKPVSPICMKPRRLKGPPQRVGRGASEGCMIDLAGTGVLGRERRSKFRCRRAAVGRKRRTARGLAWRVTFGVEGALGRETKAGCRRKPALVSAPPIISTSLHVTVKKSRIHSFGVPNPARRRPAGRRTAVASRETRPRAPKDGRRGG